MRKLATALLLLLLAANAVAAEHRTPSTATCASLGEDMLGHWPDAATRTVSTALVPAGPLMVVTGMGPPLSLTVPEHCELLAMTQMRTGALGQSFAIRFHVRLPTQWNGRFFFQGGGGSNGEVGNALGLYSPAATPALMQGFAVVSQDSGHDNTINNDPLHAGQLAFGFDAEARRNYGHASLPLVADAARAVVQQYYGKAPRYSYFVGCSKGGEEALAITQRYAERFDGVLAGAPGMSLPRAALAEAWDTQAMAAALPAGVGAPLRAMDLHRAFADDDLALVRSAILAACDNADGIADGMVSHPSACTTAKVQPELRRRQCSASQPTGCLREAQVSALLRVMSGPHNLQGKALYSDWPWDAGIAAAGWRIWKMGGANGQPPPLNVVLGGASLASVFTTPPTALPADPDALLRYQLNFSFDTDAPKIDATTATFPMSAWEAVSARSSNLDAFRARHGKLIVYHGLADPVFSANDTIAWWHELNQRYAGGAGDFARLFPVPGMNHCGGGDATDQFDALAALIQWVEYAQPPQRIVARAGAGSPWPGRERPLCPFPRAASYAGKGDREQAASFVCR